jgi:hypothetical protein
MSRANGGGKEDLTTGGRTVKDRTDGSVRGRLEGRGMKLGGVCMARLPALMFFDSTKRIAITRYGVTIYEVLLDFEVESNNHIWNRLEICKL